MRSLLLTAVALLLPYTGTALAQDKDRSQTWLSRSGYYRVSYEAKLEPLTINKIHDWIFHIENTDGTPVKNATISITGGMPNHNHGLPTNPRMTQSLGGGDYVLEGMRFHMHGYWELTVTVEADDRRDTVIIPLTL